MLNIKPEARFVNYPNPDVNPMSDMFQLSGHEEQYKETFTERIYILAIDNKVAKIGGTYTGMMKRTLHQSWTTVAHAKQS